MSFKEVLISLCLSDGGDYGLDEQDMEASVATVQSLCEQVDADLILLRERTGNSRTCPRLSHPSSSRERQTSWKSGLKMFYKEIMLKIINYLLKIITFL